ncbi:MAG: 50S ribosomal protein L16 [Candidatus Hepatoplasma vulgare]|nr:MAG: 50S ribosomal protein L16 [Candidatus Hepatoplasma sp.]
MLSPKKQKYKKPHKISYEGKAKRGTKISFGIYGLQALDGAYITSRQIEATRVAITRYLKRNGKVWIRIFPQLPITKKPLEVRMGKGKGSVDHYSAVVKKGMILFEVDQVTEEQALEALRLGMHKLPIKCKIVKKGEENV